MYSITVKIPLLNALSRYLGRMHPHADKAVKFDSTKEG